MLKIPLLLLTSLLALTFSVVTPSAAELSITFIANEGFLIECQDEKFAVDAFFGGPDAVGYQMPSDSIIQLMKTAAAPFDHINLIAVTHAHHDHFDAGMVASYLRHNPKTMVVCPPQAAELLAREEGYADFSPRLRPISHPDDSVITLEIGSISIAVLTGKHGQYIDTDELTGEKIDRHREVRHLEFLFFVGERKIYHSGDAPLNDINRYRRLEWSPVDVALTQWFTPRPRSSFRENLVREAIGAETIIMMHIPPGRVFSDPEQKKICAERKIIVPTRSLEKWLFR